MSGHKPWSEIEFKFDGQDETFDLDGGRCKPCGGTVVAEPVEANAAPRLRCRDCGERNLL